MPDAISVTYHDYHRTVIAYHGTTQDTARALVQGDSFKPSDDEDEWLGKGRYFWEYAPKQAWWWARRKFNDDAAVVGAVVRLGNCFDLLDPMNVEILREYQQKLAASLPPGTPLPTNTRIYKKLDCAVFNFVYNQNRTIDTARAVYVPTQASQRVWHASWIYEETHIQICVRRKKNILALWHVREDGRYGIDDP